jgi:hypothetical protein
MADEYKRVEEKKKDFTDLNARRDKDKDLYFMKAYQMMRLDNPSIAMDNVINVTLNDPTTFAMRAIAILGTTERQTVVEGRGREDKQNTLIENFIDDISFAIDDWLANQGILSLDSFLNEQFCIRGTAVGRCCLREEEKDGERVLVPDVIPIDSRFVIYDMGRNGLKWVAPTFKRGKEDIKDEYGITITGEEGEVIDFWDAQNNVIFIGGKEQKRQKNPYGYPPFIITQTPAGSMLADKDAYPHRGESIFWANRDLFPELNRTASIFQTLNVAAFRPGLQYASKAGTKATKPKKPLPGVDFVVSVDEGGGFKSMPITDIQNAARLFYAILYTRIQQGGLSAIDYGNLTFPLAAVAITQLTSSRDQIFLPRIKGKAIFYQQLFKMLIKQYQLVNIKAKLGQEGWTKEYNPKDLEGDYQIKFRFFTESKEQEIANYSVANAAKGFLSESTIRRNILNVPDPEAEEERIAIEQAEKVDEVLFLYNRCKSLIFQSRVMEYRILKNRLIGILKARQGLAQLPTEDHSKKLGKPGGRQIIPLLGQGDAGGTVAPEVGAEQQAIDEAQRQAEATAAVGTEAKQGRI